MSQPVLVKLREKRNPDNISDTIQFSEPITKSVLDGYLNAVIGNSVNYLYYYNESVLSDDFKEINSNLELLADVENNIIIDYDVPPDPDVIYYTIDPTKILLHCSGNLYALGYEGILGIYNRDTPFIYKDYWVSICEDGLQIYALKQNKIFRIDPENLEGNVEIVEIDTNGSNILNFSRCEDMIAIGVDSNTIIIKDKENRLIYTPQTSFKFLHVNKNILYYVDSIGTIVKYDPENDKIKTNTTLLTLTGIQIYEKTIYASAIQGKIVVCNKDKTTSYPVKNMFFLRGIHIHENMIFVWNQFTVVGMDLNEYTIRLSLSFKEQINTVTVGDGVLYVALSTRILGFELCKYLS